MNVYPVLKMGARNTVQKYLSKRGLKPRIKNPGTTIPKLIQCKGIIHYTRSGTRKVVTSTSYAIKDGDFLVVAVKCVTGANFVIPAIFKPTDYAFIMGSQDSFFKNAKDYMNRRPCEINNTNPKRYSVTKYVTSCKSFKEILKEICKGKNIITPINDVLIVSHASGDGILFFKIDKKDRDNKIYLDQLCPYVQDTKRTKITTREMQDRASTNIHIRGCNIGNNTDYLRLIKKTFGTQVIVTAPKHIDYFGYFYYGTVANIKYEFMLYDFVVYQKNRAANKSKLVQLFDNKSFSDIHGTGINQSKWNTWIPRNTRKSIKARFTCNNPIHSRIGRYIKREFKYKYRTIYTYKISIPKGAKVPRGKSDRIKILKQSLPKYKEMKSDYPSSQCPYPKYLRWGFQDVDDMIDNLAWSISRKGSILEFIGKRYEYKVRIPITDANNNLMLNAIPSTGARQYTRNDIKIGDNRFFASV